MKKLLLALLFAPSLAFAQSAAYNLSQLAHQLLSGGTVPVSAGGTGITSLLGYANDCLVVNTGASGFSFATCGSGSGTVTDGSGTTTANELAISTTTAHTIGYAATLPTAAMPALSGDLSGTAGSLNVTVSKVSGVSGTPTTFTTYNATSGSITISPPTGALGTINLTWPDVTGTLPAIFGTITPGDCTKWYSATQVEDAGAACGTSGMVYPGAGIAVSTGSAWGTSINGGSNTIVGNAGSGQAALTPSQAIGVLNSGAANAQTGTTYVFALTDANGEVTMSNAAANTATVPPQPLGTPTNGALTQTAGGTLAATTYYVRSTWVSSTGETLAATETSLAVSANNVLNVAAPGSAPATATGWNVYVSTAPGTETKQNASPIGTGAAWVEPTSGMIAGSALPGSDTSGVDYANGALLTLQEKGTGVTSLAPATGVTITSAVYGSSATQTYSLGGVYGFIQIQQTATNTWNVVGWTTPVKVSGGSYSLSGTCTTSAHNGNAVAGSVTLSSAGGCTVILTFTGVPAPADGFVGKMSDQTQSGPSAYLYPWGQSSSTTSSITFSVPGAAAIGDVLTFGPIAGY